MKKFVYTIIGMIIAAIVIITFIGCDGAEVANPVETLDVTETETTESYVVITETSVITTTTTETTTATDTTSSTTTTETTSESTTIAVDESVNVIDYNKVVNDSVNETVKEVEPITDTVIETTTETVYTSSDATEVEETDTEVEETEPATNLTLVSTITELTYYSGPTGCKGRYNRTLANDYSIACNSLPDGTIVHIESDNGEINGDYRVDDTGGMGNKVIDIFYCSYNNVPKNFKRDGRISCTVWIVEE